MRTRQRHTYRVEKARAETALGLTDVQDWGWEAGQFLIQNSTTITENIPINHVDRINYQETIVYWDEVKSRFFAGVPEHAFDRMSVTFDSTYIYFDLNQEMVS